MKSENEQLHELIMEGNSLLENSRQDVIPGLAVPIGINPRAYNAWIAKIRVWLNECCTDMVRGKFEELIRPKNSSVARVKKILVYLNSLRDGMQ